LLPQSVNRLSLAKATLAYKLRMNSTFIKQVVNFLEFLIRNHSKNG
jgi:hypothetical protein